MKRLGINIIFSFLLILGLGFPAYLILKNTAKANGKPKKINTTIPPPPKIEIEKLKEIKLDFKENKNKKTGTLILNINAQLPFCSSGPGLAVWLKNIDTLNKISKPLNNNNIQFKDIKPGVWELKIGLFLLKENILYKKKINISPGEKKIININSLGLGKVSGRIKNAKKPVKVSIWTSGGWCNSVSDKNGNFSFNNLIPGKALVIVGESPYSKTIPVEIPNNGDINIVVENKALNSHLK